MDMTEDEPQAAAEQVTNDGGALNGSEAAAGEGTAVDEALPSESATRTRRADIELDTAQAVSPAAGGRPALVPTGTVEPPAALLEAAQLPRLLQRAIRMFCGGSESLLMLSGKTCIPEITLGVIVLVKAVITSIYNDHASRICIVSPRYTLVWGISEWAIAPIPHPHDLLDLFYLTRVEGAHCPESNAYSRPALSPLRTDTCRPRRAASRRHEADKCGGGEGGGGGGGENGGGARGGAGGGGRADGGEGGGGGEGGCAHRRLVCGPRGLRGVSWRVGGVRSGAGLAARSWEGMQACAGALGPVTEPRRARCRPLR
jgi:hypothetical protein